jgi:ketosteroid isomerase-like protein
VRKTEWLGRCARKWILRRRRGTGTDTRTMVVPVEASRGPERSLAPDARTGTVIDAFARAWASPRVDAFIALLHSDVVLLQPVTPPIRGRDAARREFTRLLQWLPDLHGTVDDAAAHASVALIAWRLRFTLGGAPYELRIADRLVVADGLIREREAYYDSLQLMIALVRRPRAWPGYWRYRGFVPG